MGKERFMGISQGIFGIMVINLITGGGHMTKREINKPQIEQAVRMILEAIGEDPEREGVLTTPKRVKDIPIYSMCEHHLLPFYGKAHVAYIPKGGKVVGISKLARVAEAYAHRPQLQERLTSQIADCINDTLNPYAVGVIIEAEHMCMTMRGIRKPGSVTVTSAVRGLFETRSEVRAELFALINSK